MTLTLCVGRCCQANPRAEREQHEEVHRGAQAAGSDSVSADRAASQTTPGADGQTAPGNELRMSIIDLFLCYIGR